MMAVSDCLQDQFRAVKLQILGNQYSFAFTPGQFDKGLTDHGILTLGSFGHAHVHSPSGTPPLHHTRRCRDDVLV